MISLLLLSAAVSGDTSPVELDCVGTIESFIVRPSHSPKSKWHSVMKLDLNDKSVCMDECSEKYPASQADGAVTFAIPDDLFALSSGGKTLNQSQYNYIYRPAEKSLRGFWSARIGTNLQKNIEATCTVVGPEGSVG